ncbi:FAS1 domain-containing protein [Hypoxylon sp. FL1284]|nr:FAS1 domain-containing protein [Hypoxylon sp. FL1284]
MHSQSFTTALLLVSTAASVASQSLPGLMDALKASGASKFADFIQSDPDLLQLYLSDQVKTVFAPCDLAPEPTFDNETLTDRDLNTPKGRAGGLQSSSETTSLGITSRTRPGGLISTNEQSPLLNNQPQKVVADTRSPNETSPIRRWISSSGVRRRANETAPPSLLRIASGLGNIANVIKGDIPYDGGVIQLMDSYFTMPQSLSSTSEATGQTAFSNQLSESNMTSKLDTTPLVTVFLPSNAAFASSNSSIPASQLVTDHLVTGTVSYLPDLQDGMVLTTQKGETLVVSVRGGRYYVNGGLITQANLILENGVAHVVDKVLKPNPATKVPGAAAANSVSLAGLFGLASYVGMMVLA